MPLPDRTLIRRGLALGAAILILALIAAVLIAREPPPPPPAAQAPQPIKIETPPLPVPSPPLSRADLIALSARAASAYATGAPPPAQDAGLSGRRFIVRIAFGCEGPRDEDAAPPAAYWEQDPARGTIALRAHPQIWTTTAWVRELAGSAQFDAVEGFWLPRPWITSEDCPAQAAAGGEKTLGLAMFFAPNSSRVLQRGARAYEFVGKAPDGGAPVAPKGFRLILAGRIAGFEGGEPARCHAAGPDQRPACLIAVDFDQVAFEDPATGETLAEWRMN